MRITVDMDVCQSHGQCVFAAPGSFSFDDDEYLRYDPAPDDALRDSIAKAAASCPVRAITVVPVP